MNIGHNMTGSHNNPRSYYCQEKRIITLHGSVTIIREDTDHRTKYEAYEARTQQAKNAYSTAPPYGFLVR